MENTFLIITSIANQEHAVLKQFAAETSKHNVPFIVIGDTKSPKEFNLAGCDFYSIERLSELDLREGIENIPVNMKLCYDALIELGFVGQQESILLDAWLKDVNTL